MLVKNLIGLELLYWVAKAEGKKLTKRDGEWFVCNDANDWMFELELYHPRADALLEKGLITIQPNPFLRDKDGTYKGWLAHSSKSPTNFIGDKPLLAISRALVASVFGDEVESIKED